MSYARYSRQRVSMAILAGTTAFVAPAAAVAEESVLRIGMTAGDIPLTHGQPDQGFEGNRFTGIPIYDALTQWDLSQEDEPSTLMPGLATSWEIDPEDDTRWIFELREGVTYHDGSEFTAEDVVWNVEKVLDEDAEHFDASQVGVTASRMPTLRSAEVIDDYTVALYTSEPDSFLPINLTNLFMASPDHWAEKYDETGDSDEAWSEFAADPSGSGPFRVTGFTARERLELQPNDAYWDDARTPTIDRVVMRPMPDANSRTAALLSGEVDWIEAPAPDAMAQMEGQGFVIYSNPQPHVWPWQFSFLDDSPWLDREVRHAANLCVDREELSVLLNGHMGIPQGTVGPDHPWWGDPDFEIRYDPDTARELMEEVGYSSDDPVEVRVQTSASGSGQMQPLVMNEYLQDALAECYFDVELDVIEWNTLFTNWREGADASSANDAHAINVTFATMDPFFAMVRFLSSDAHPPVSNNWGYFTDDEFDDLIAQARTTFDPDERDEALGQLHKRKVEEAPFLWVAHDAGPRAISPSVGNVVQPQSWFIDIATMTME